VAPGETLVLQLDMDANKSIHTVQKGKKQEYPFRPVVFIDIVTDAFRDRHVTLGVFLVTATSTSGSSEPVGVAQLVPRQEVDVHGSEATDGCFEADAIIAFEPGATLL
jgi:hypothetical protein